MVRSDRTFKRKLAIAGLSTYELLITIAILGILISVTMASFSEYARTQQYVRFVDEVGHQIRLAKQMTLASKDDTQYGIYVGTSTIELFSGTTPVVGSAANQILDFGGTQYTATSSFSDTNWYVTFSRITGEASATGTISVSSAALGRTATYTIRSSGLVE